MNIYLLTQTQRRGYDTYDSCVVIAADVEAAKSIHPRGLGPADWQDQYTWADTPKEVTAEHIGVTLSAQARVVCSSFNAG